jgi:hypothetical protein
MTTTPARPPVTWLVKMPEGDPFGRTCLKAACRGKCDLGDLLNYFLYAASWEAQNKKLDTSAGTITVTRTLDQMQERIAVSKKTLIAYNHQLAAWKFITPHGYRHSYDVHFDAIAEAITNPPAPERPKLRGRHARRSEQDVKSINPSIPTVKSSIPARDARDERINLLEEGIVNLTSQIVNLQSRIVDLTSQIVNLQSLQSSEAALGEAREAKTGPLLLRESDNVREDSFVASDDGTFKQEEATTTPPPHDEKHEGISCSQGMATGRETTPPQEETQEHGEHKIPPPRRLTMQECTPEVRSRRRAWQLHFNKRRGGEKEYLNKEGARRDENFAIADLVEAFTDEQIKAIDAFVLKEIFPYKQEHMRHTVGGRIVFDQAQNARETLKRRRTWPGQIPTPPPEDDGVLKYVPLQGSRQAPPPARVPVAVS